MSSIGLGYSASDVDEHSSDIASISLYNRHLRPMMRFSNEQLKETKEELSAVHFSMRSRHNSFSKKGLPCADYYGIGGKKVFVINRGTTNQVNVMDIIGGGKDSQGVVFPAGVSFIIRGFTDEPKIIDKTRLVQGYLRQNVKILNQAIIESGLFCKGDLAEKTKEITIILADKYDYPAGDHRKNNIIILNAPDIASMIDNKEDPVFISTLLTSLLTEELTHERDSEGNMTEEIMAGLCARNTVYNLAVNDKSLFRYIRFLTRYGKGVKGQKDYLGYLSKAIPVYGIYRDLYKISQNLWFDNDYKARELFKMMDPGLWASKEIGKNPGLFLKNIDIERLIRLTFNIRFLFTSKRLIKSYESYMDPKRETWITANHPELKDKRIAYSSLQFGAGDQIKEMSDKGFNFIGTGLAYKNIGQSVEYIYKDFLSMPKKEVMDKEGKPLRLKIPMYAHTVYARVWEVQFGRSRLYLLDTNLEDNAGWMRGITETLHTEEMREDGLNKTDLHQAYILGIGQAMLFERLGIRPDFSHLSGDHADFAVIGMIRNLMDDEGLSFKEASIAVYYKTLVEAYTPVIANNWKLDNTDITGELGYVFSSENFENLDIKEMISLGKSYNGFNAAGKIFNGVSVPYYQSIELQELLKTMPIDIIKDEELWRVHMASKKRLIEFIGQYKGRDIFKKEALTIVVSEGLAGYDENNWAFSKDFERIKTILKKAQDSNTPVQIIFVDTVYAKDNENRGRIIGGILSELEKEGMENQVVFLEGHGADITHYLAQGADIWFSYPEARKASFVNGRNAAMVNGAVVAGIRTGFTDRFWLDRKNALFFDDVKDFCDTLENFIIPVYYRLSPLFDYYDEMKRDKEAADWTMPSEPWLSLIRESLKTGLQRFSADRMIKDFTDRYYKRGVLSSLKIEKDGYRLARLIPELIKNPDELLQGMTNKNKNIKLSGTIESLEIELELGIVPPEAVEVSIIFKEEDRAEQAIKMQPVECIDALKARWRYRGIIDSLAIEEGRVYVYQVRLRPVINLGEESNWYEKRTQESELKIISAPVSIEKQEEKRPVIIKNGLILDLERLLKHIGIQRRVFSGT